MNQIVKRNMMAFEAPLSLTEQTKQMAEEKMCSISTICRQALSSYILTEYDKQQADEYTIF